ncbi:MAG: RHS repeat-associated core domain-containing protein, partial [Methylovulum sp.]|nr:RHS repeat-associated core domain-containing protein [Methylovulum sp.]
TDPQGKQTRYVYGQADHLLYELLPNGSQRNYVWLGDIPLAVIDQNAAGGITARYFIETDFTNTPRLLRRYTDKIKVWQWPFAAYGNAQALEDPDGDGGKVTFNLRYPGQYYDAESGLHYNHTRYFSPRTGRYLQPDLIKLAGGVNVYTYANGNPIGYTDPTGTAAEDSLGSYIGSFLNDALSLFESSRLGNATGSMGSLAQDTMNIPGVQIAFSPGLVVSPGGAEWRAAKEAVKLYRAVGPSELADIQATNIFRNLGSAEGKYFTTSEEAASSYAKQAVNGFGDPPYTLIQTQAPKNIFEGLSPATVDRGIPAWVIPNERLPGLTPKMLNYMSIP